MNTENRKTSEPRRFKLDLTVELNLKDENNNNNNNIASADLSIYYTWKTSSQNTATLNSPMHQIHFNRL